jgi:hypothetical protein
VEEGVFCHANNVWDSGGVFASGVYFRGGELSAAHTNRERKAIHTVIGEKGKKNHNTLDNFSRALSHIQITGAVGCGLLFPSFFGFLPHSNAIEG